MVGPNPLLWTLHPSVGAITPEETASNRLALPKHVIAPEIAFRPIHVFFDVYQLPITEDFLRTQGMCSFVQQRRDKVFTGSSRSALTERQRS